MRNLIGRLLDRSPTELDRIATHWGVNLSGRDRYTDVASIYRQLTDIWSVRDVWNDLSQMQRTTIMAMARGPDTPATPEELAALTEVQESDVTETLRDLYRLGIVAVDQPAEIDNEQPPRLYLPRELGSMFERIANEQGTPSDLSQPLEEILATLPYIDIEEAAGHWGARVTPGVHSRAELINVISSGLTRPERVRAVTSHLSQPARNIWQLLQEADGSLPLTQVREITSLSDLAFRDTLRELGSYLLVWHEYRSSPNGHERWLIIPDGILNPTVPEPEPIPEVPHYDVDDVYEPEWMFPQSGAWDLLTILREAVRDSPRTSALFGGDSAVQRRLSGRLWRADVESGVVPTGYLPFLARIGALLGVLQDLDGRTIPGPESEAWRSTAFTTAGRRMAAVWTGADDWIEGRDRIDLALYGASWPAFRATLLRTLADIDDNTWVDQDQFVEFILASEPDLLRQAQVGSVPNTQLTMRVENNKQPKDRRADVLRLVISMTLETACVWLGIIERSQHIQNGQSVFRVTPFGRWIGGRGPEPSGQYLGPAPLAVGANLQILLYRPTPRRVWALTAFAELRALDRVSTYLLTSSAVIRALASNVEIRDIVTFLERQSDQPLPQTVRYTLEEWDSGYHRVWLRRAIIMTPEDEADLERITDVLEEANLTVTRQSDGTLALLHDTGDATDRIFDQAIRALRDRGFAPLARAPEPRKLKRSQAPEADGPA